MAEELIFGALSKGGHVEITIDKNEISLKYSSSLDKKKELVQFLYGARSSKSFL